MPAIDYEYDPQGINTDNDIVNETQAVDIGIDRSVFPVHGSFFGDTLVVDGTEPGGDTRRLVPLLDYFFSPMYLEGSAAGGKEVFTYFVLLKPMTSVTYSYHVLGQYNDSILLAELTTSSHDRTSIAEWQTIQGNTTYFNPNVNNPGITDQGLLEVVSIQLERISTMINNPFSTSNVSRNEVTDLQAALANVANLPEVVNQFKNPTVSVVSDNVNGETITVFTYPKTIRNFRAIATYVTDTKTDSVDFIIVSGGDRVRLTSFGRLETDTELFTFLINENTTDIQIRATVTEPGTFILKTLFEH